MKKHLMRMVSVNLSRFIKSTVLVVMLVSAAGAKAQVTPVSATINDGSIDGKAVVTYVATGRESLFFDVKVDNDEGEKFSIIVKDENGNTIYRGTYNDKEFKKRFIIPKTDSNRLTFHIKSESGVKSETFEINTNTRLVEEVVVKKVI